MSKAFASQANLEDKQMSFNKLSDNTYAYTADGLSWAKSHNFMTGQTPVTQYIRALMQAILWDCIKIAEVVGVKVISVDDAPQGYAQFDAEAPTKFVIDPHRQLAKV